jgi:type II secretion system protein N
MGERMKNPKVIVGMVAIFVVSFLFFLYLSFPYGVLKEAIATQVQLATGVTLRMESFGPAFPFGFTAEGVELYKGQSARFKVKSVSARFSIWQLFALRLGAGIDIEDPKGGDLDMSVGFGLLDVLTGNLNLPSKVVLSAKGFNIESLTAFLIQVAVDGGVGGAVAGPLLGKLGFRGKLTGNIDLSLNSKSPAQSSGDVKVNLSEAVLVLSDPSLNFPDQAFKTAQITAVLGNGVLNIDPTTRFTTADLEMGVDGKVALRPQMTNSDLSLKGFVKLHGLLGEQYGMLIDGLSNGMSKNGSLSLQIAGTLGAPQVNPI